MVETEMTAPTDVGAQTEQSFYEQAGFPEPPFAYSIPKISENVKPLKLINMADVKIRSVEWLWYPFIPLRKITLLQGDSGEGKTTLVMQLIGRLTTGRPLFGEVYDREPVNVIYQTAEDGLDDTIAPRLKAAGADCKRVNVIDDKNGEPLTFVDSRLEQAIAVTRARLVVLDPIQGFLGVKTDMNKANEVRPIMYKLGNIAEKYSCAIVLVGHIGKCVFGKAVANQGLGSVDFTAAARSVLRVARLKTDPQIRCIIQPKSNLAPESKTVGFRLVENGFEWLGEINLTADELLSGNISGGEQGLSFETLFTGLKKLIDSSDENEWRGTTSDLITELELDDVSPKALSQRLNKYCDKLRLHGIIYDGTGKTKIVKACRA